MSIQNKYSSSLHTLVLPSFTDYQYITILEDVLIHKSDFSTASGFMLSQEARPNTLQKNMFEQEVSYVQIQVIVAH